MEDLTLAELADEYTISTDDEQADPDLDRK